MQVNHHPTNEAEKFGQHVVSPCHKMVFNQSSLPVVAPYYPHDAGWATVPYTGQNPWENFFPRASEPKHTALVHWATVQDEDRTINFKWFAFKRKYIYIGLM